MKKIYLFSIFTLMVAFILANTRSFMGISINELLSKVGQEQPIEHAIVKAEKETIELNERLQAPITLRILHNNDGESKLEPNGDIGGAAEFKTAVDSLKAAGLPSIMLSSGDNFLAGIAFNASLNRGAGLPYYDAEVLDAIGYDAIAIGNHDFDFGPDVLEKMITDQTSGTPYLNANLDFSGEAGLQALVDAGRIAPSTIIDVNGEQVGVIGLIYEDVATITSLRNVTVDPDLVGIAQEQINALETSGVNKIILITHLQSINNELDLIAQLDGVDVVIAGGGDELLTNNPANEMEGLEIFDEYPIKTTDASGDTVYVVTTPGEYRFIGNLIVDFDDQGIVSNIAAESDVILIQGFEPDADLKANVVDSVTAYAANLDQNIIATTEVALDGTRAGVRTRETNQGNLITDAFLWLANQEAAAQGLDSNIPIVALQNGGGIRNDEIIAAGSDISERKTFDMLPFSNSVVVLDPISPDSLKAALENSVSRVENRSGRFMQVAGLSLVYSPFGASDVSRVKAITLDDGTKIVENYEVVPGAPDVYIVTNSFTAAGGDDYPEFAALGVTQLGFSYQRALFEYIVNGPINGLISAADYPEGGEGRITTEGGTAIPDSDKEFNLFKLGTFETGVFDEGAAEIVAHDPATQRVFSVNADANTVSVISIANPFYPVLVNEINMDPYGAGVNSVDVNNGIVAVASEAEAVDANGKVVFFDTDGNYLNDVEVGVLPDMLTFTPDGTRVITANEGQPSDDYSIDPEGSVSIIDVSSGVENATVNNVNFQQFNGQEEALRAQGIRIFGPEATAAQDLEPEYVTVIQNETQFFAIVVMQENNALMGIDIPTATINGLLPLGFKDHSLPANGLDASNENDDIVIKSWPVLGMYQPDAIKSVNISGTDYLITANEGDARDYDDFSEETRVADLTLDPAAYPNAATLQLDSELGRLRTTDQLGDTDDDGDFDQIYSYGARSFSIWDLNGNVIFDSGDHIEQTIAQIDPDNFNANNDDNDSRKSRSDDKGPEPEAIEIVELDGSVFALVGLERVGGIMVYDISDPTAPEFVGYTNNRNFDVDAETSEAGDLGIEDIRFIPANESPVGIPLVVTANEVSGTVTVFAVNEMPEMPDFALRIIHNNDGESKLEPQEVDGMFIGGAAEFKTVVDSLKSTTLPRVTLSSGDNFLAGITFNASLNRAEGAPYYDAEVLDAIGYDAIAIGNHDFDFGPDVLEKMITDQASGTPYLSANLDFSAEPGLQSLVDAGRIAPSTVINVSGEKVGVIGLIYEDVATITSLRNVTVDPNLVSIAQAQIDALEAEGVNKVVLITHLQSINNELDLIGQLNGVDIVIAGGGDELLTNNPSNAVDGLEVFDEYPIKATDASGDTVFVVTTPGEYRYVGNLIIEFDDQGNVTSVADESDVILVKGFEPDADLDTNVVDSVRAYAANLDQNIIASTEVDLDGTRAGVRTRETNQGNLITDAFLWLANQEAAVQGLDPDIPIVALQNGGGIRNDEVIPAGSDISERKTFDMLPFSNSVVVTDPITPDSLKALFENSVSRVENRSGRFMQVAGLTLVYDPNGMPDVDRVLNITLDDGTEIVANGEVVESAPDVYIVTNSFTADGGDDYPELAALGKTQLGFSYQRALFEFLINGPINGLIAAADYPEGGEGRITTMMRPYQPKVIAESNKQFDLFFLGTYETGIFDEGASEIVAYDAVSRRLFSVNADANSVSVVSIVNPFSPTLVDNIDMSEYGDGVNGIDVFNGLVAVASEAEAVDANGKVVFFDTLGNYINDVEVGVLPDMVTFTPDGTKVLVANEGEPNDDYTVDPEGSVSIINVANGAENAQVVNITFTQFNGQEEVLRSQGVRIFGPNASAAQDLEPEYIAITEDGLNAFVSCQENNAAVLIDINSATIVGIAPLGFKDHSLPGNGFDASNRSTDINIRNWPVLGMYQPDAIKSINIDGVDYIVSANEGDARDYDGFSEEERVGGLILDPDAYPNAAELQVDSLLGRLNSTLATGDTDGDGDIDQIYAYGARSFSIWAPYSPDVESALIFDSGDHIEQKTAELLPGDFNSNNDENDSRKSRSDDKGPEPEAVELVRYEGSIFALIGLERIGGVMIYDITDPTAPEYVNYVNNRDFSVEDATSSAVGDLGVEDIVFIPLDQSPVNAALVVTSNEVSGTVSVFSVNTIPDEPVSSDDLNLAAYDFKVGPVPFGANTVLTYNLPHSSDVNIALMDIQGRSLQTITSSRQPAGEYTFQIDGERLPQGVYNIFVTIDGQANSIKVVKQ